MQESLVKLVLVLIGIVCLTLGVVLMVIPGWFFAFTGAEAVNVGWIRTMGAGLVGLQGFGLLAAAFRRRDTNPLLSMAALSTTFLSGGLWYSIFGKEFSATTTWPVIVGGVAATIAAVLLWVAWLSRRKSLKGLAPRASKPGKSGRKALSRSSDHGDDAEELDQLIPTDAEVEEIAGPSPRRSD